MFHATLSTPRRLTWRWIMAAVAFAAYFMTGMHLACADERISLSNALCITAAADGETGHGHAVAHCHVVHAQASQAAAPAMPLPGMTASRVAMSPDATPASVTPPRLEDPPRT